MIAQSNLLLFLITLTTFSFAQTVEKKLKVVNIIEYIDGYVLQTVDPIKPDTLYVISVKDNINRKCKYEKISVGKEYYFVVEDIVRQMAQYPANGLTVRIKKTVIWKEGDEVSKLPIFSRNTKGLYIRKRKIKH